MLKKGRIAKVIILLLSVGIILTVMYYVFNPKKALNLVFPGINEISYVHIDLKNDSSLVSLYVLVQNKMPYKLVIDTIHFEVELNGFKIAEETIALQIDQSRYDSDTIELPVSLSLQGISKIIDELQGQDSTNMDVNFWISYKTIIGNPKIHLHKKIRVLTPVPIHISILKLEQKKYKLAEKTSEANLKVEIINNGNAMDLQLNAISYNLQIRNTLSSKGDLVGSIDIKPTSSLIVDIPLIIEYDSPLKTAWQIFADNDSATYDLNIQAILTVNNFEKPYRIPVEVDATGSLELVKN